MNRMAAILISDSYSKGRRVFAAAAIFDWQMVDLDETLLHWPRGSSAVAGEGSTETRRLPGSLPEPSAPGRLADLCCSGRQRNSAPTGTRSYKDLARRCARGRPVKEHGHPFPPKGRTGFVFPNMHNV